MADLKTLQGVDAKDRRMIEEAEAILGPPPGNMGFDKNLFWGHVREDLIFPYPSVNAEEKRRCDTLLAALDAYLDNEHPSTLIDQEQQIPDWVIRRLFELGVLGMIIPREYGGGGFGITSYNRVLERIGRSCGSTAVMVSAHQSIGCGAIVMFGTEDQKRRWLPHLASDWLSAFCLSEPNVGCDAGGQETRCELSADGSHYILNGEKKWATSGALAKLFTVMAKQKFTDPTTGKSVEKVTALVCTPEMPGIDIYENNRSKCGIRGTWQARMRFTDVKVPRDHLLHIEGKGLNVALSCLDYGRCTLSAGMLGGAKRAFEQGTKWAQTRYQFQRPLADFELVKAKIARMSALCYAMDAVLYMTTGMLDRHDEDIMVETALCKMFCSEMGWRVVNDCVQIMGGEGYMTENEIERIFRDSRINLIVEGANEVMQSFVFAYGGKQLAEKMLGVQQAVGWDHHESPSQNLSRILRGLKRPGVLRAAAPLGAEFLLGVRPAEPEIHDIHESLRPMADRFCHQVREHSHQFKLASRHYGAQIITRQAVQARLADSAMWLHAWACTLSKFDHEIREFKHDGNGNGMHFDRNKAAAIYFMKMADREIDDCFRRLFDNDDSAMTSAADAALTFSKTLPNSRFIIPERSPNAKGTGRAVRKEGVKQFGKVGDERRETREGTA
jgi:alkylation response protein AidB-like acyl-CoA dehydrogenase